MIRSRTEEPISTYDETNLCDYFETKIKKPKWRPWLKSVDNVSLESDIGPVKIKIGKVKEIWRSLTEESRYKYAAWWWLRPHNPCYGLEHLADIQKQSALDHVDRAVFIKRLLDYSLPMRQDYPKLARWITKRTSLLEYALSTSKELSEELHHTAQALRFSLMSAQNALWQEGKAADNEAREIIYRALEAGASAVKDVLGKESPCRVSANLMVRVRLPSREGPGFVPNEEANDNADKASHLWDGCVLPDHALVIVAETQGSNHIGFWVPLLRGDGDTDLPGASSAYFQMAGSAVFKDDLPPLKGFSNKLKHQWHAYITTRLQEKMFVSIPLTCRDPKTQKEIVLAVMNVNADPPPEDGWRRAYHREWLTAAQNAAQNFIEIAFQGLWIVMAAKEKTGNLQLDTGSSTWNSLPGAAASNCLPASYTLVNG